MKRAMLFLALVLATTAFTQPKKYIQFPFNEWIYNDTLAARVWSFHWDEYCKDSVFSIYIKQSIWWTKDTGSYQTFQFKFDSVTGRGDQRKALFTIAYVTPRDSDWWILRVNDSTGLYDTLGRSTDSTWRASNWLTYTRRDYWNQNVDSTGKGAGRWVMYWFKDRDSTSPGKDLIISLEKILGDPTKNNGWNQIGRFRFIYRDAEPEWFRRKYFGWNP
jgi:hypothetical protein